MQSAEVKALKGTQEGAQLQEPEHGADGKVVIEQVERCSKRGTELVQVNGFQFFRKRKRTDLPQEQAQPGLDAANVQPVPGPAAGAGAAAAGPQHGAEGANPSEGAAEQLPQAAPPPAAVTPTDSLQQQQQQQDNAQQQEAGPAGPMEVEEAQPDDKEEEQQPPLQPPQPAPEKDLKAVVSNLISGVIPAGCPTAVSVTWLLRETLREALPPGDAAGAAAAATMVQAFQQALDQKVTAAQQLLLLGAPEHLRQFDALPPMVRGMCASERHMALLRQQLRALEQEEAAWLGMKAKYRPGADCLGGAGDDNESGAAAEGEPPAEEQQQQHVDVAFLEDAQRRAEHHLSLQVDAINDMLDKVELVLAKAQQQCATLQAEYHKESFKPFAHIDSPKMLVKILSQVPPSGTQDFVPSSLPMDG
ncbi:hypothetical protein PLESTB_000133100 [Pleodorina starrii]|uniref:Uncharacterized protein n=1 Tax=Pleodorina starrii TaxID=330485 RepID=A0A9W6BAY7_9CHLO|nr:hypothetical protein PLESTM_000491800 [Pleodorina starrii]GLC48753.1 hypothetical protein PLESTB_000133100 [Pleodorina starrii]GLC74298.1 hypothetical protein PLESTF_001486500 [Pleodorina starrii]